MKNRLISVLLVAGLMLSISTCYVFAAAQPVTLDPIQDKKAGDSFNITGTSTAAQVTVKLINPDGDVISNNIVAVNVNTFSSPLTVPGDKGFGTFTVQAIIGDGSAKVSTSFKVSAATASSGDNGGGTTPSGGGTTSGTTAASPSAVNISATVSDSDMGSAISGMKNGTVSLTLKNMEEANSVKTTIPLSSLFAAGAGVERLKVDMGIAKITLDMDILKNGEKTNPSSMELSVSKVDVNTLSAEARSIIGANPVYDINLSIDGKNVKNFGRHEIKVELKYTLKAGENPNNVVIYYIDEMGKLQVVPECRYNSETGMVEFYPKHLSQYAASCAAVAFKDISNVAWAKESIEALAARGIITAEDDKFNPSANIKRAELIDYLMKANGLVDDSAACSFKDMKKGSPYYRSVASAEKLGITSGVGNGNFGAADEIIRQDMAVWLYKIALLKKADTNSGKSIVFTDRSSISPYAMDAVDMVTKMAVMKGVGSGKFMPKGKVTKAQGAMVAYSMFKITY